MGWLDLCGREGFADAFNDAMGAVPAIRYVTGTVWLMGSQLTLWMGFVTVRPTAFITRFWMLPLRLRLCAR